MMASSNRGRAEAVRRRRSATVLASMAILLSSCSASTHAVQRGPLAIPAADMLTLQMFTSSEGVGVAFAAPPPLCHRNCAAGAPSRHRDYLVATSDSGATWRVSGALPADFNPGESYEVQVAFSSPDEGYVQSTEPPATLFTDDAGQRWSSLKTPGEPTDISLAGPALWIVSDFCPKATTPTGLCPSRLLIYAPGHLTPSRETPIPTEGNLAEQGISPGTREAHLLVRLGPRSAVFAEGSESSPSSLLFTGDSGLHWTVLSDPCDGISPTGLVAPTSTKWDLYCQLSGGMNQGRTRFYASTDRGKTWTLVAEGNVEGPSLGNIGVGMADDLTVSGDGRVLWLVGSVYGIKSSTDGGRDWTTVPIQTDGYDSELATAGPSSAWLPIPAIGLYHTTNGATWNLAAG